MEIDIQCEACHVPLRVPYEAAGHRARCASCGHEFIVPPSEILLEEAVSEWIEQDVEEVFEDRARSMEAIGRRRPVPTPAGTGAGGSDGDRDSKHDRPHDPLDGTRSRGDGHARQAGSGGSAAPDHEGRRRRLWPMRSRPHESVPEGVALPDEPAYGSGITSRSLDGRQDAMRSRSRSDRAVSCDAADPAERYPTNLHIEKRIPHLMVRKVDSAGVRFAFDSVWLNHDCFRASIPVRCAFSGETAREKLIARPLVFLDRCQQARPSVEQLVGTHENRQLGDRSPRDIMHAMGVIEGMPRPFTFAMPYYVSTRCAHLPLHCETRDRTSGGITCEVLIPDQHTALDWLARVNGVCGREYELLEQDVNLLHGDAWQELTEEARSRITVWCKLAQREVLRHYFNDADFGRHDAGLAGLVVTDQRLVFCKYHHRGQVRLDVDDASIIAKCEPRFANLSLRVGNHLSRMIKLHRQDLDVLAEALAARGKITMEMTNVVP